MKNRNCPNKDACWDYDASNCEGCAVGQKIEKYVRKIRECLQILYDRIDCGYLMLTPFVQGWNEAISTVFKEISEKYGVSMEDEE